MTSLAEELREVMRLWVSGVAVVSSSYEGICHGMTVNSFHSISLFPALITITLANDTRTKNLISKSNIFALTILEEDQQELAETFAGKGHPTTDRFAGLEIYTLISECPLLKKGIAHLDCRVIHLYEMPTTTLFVGEVLAANYNSEKWPLLYMKRNYFTVKR